MILQMVNDRNEFADWEKNQYKFFFKSPSSVKRHSLLKREEIK